MIPLFKKLKYLEANEIAGPDTINPIIQYLRNVRSVSPYLTISQDDKTGGLIFDLDDTLFRQPPAASSSGKDSSSSKSTSKSASKSSSSVDSSSVDSSSSKSTSKSSSSVDSSSSKISSSSVDSSSIPSSSSGKQSSSSIDSSSGKQSSSSGHHHDSSTSKSSSKSSSSSITPPEGITFSPDGIYIYGWGEELGYMNGYWRHVAATDLPEPSSYWIYADGFGKEYNGNWLFIRDNNWSHASLMNPPVWPPQEPDYILNEAYYSEDWMTCEMTQSLASGQTHAPTIYNSKIIDPTIPYITWEHWKETELGFDEETMEPIYDHQTLGSGTAHCVYWDGTPGEYDDDSDTSSEV